MVLDPLTADGIAVGIGAAAGSISAYLGWNASGETFNIKRFIAGLATGVISAVGLVAVNFEQIKTAAAADPSGAQFFELMLLLGLGVLGVDYARTKISGMIANREPAPVNPTSG